MAQQEATVRRRKLITSALPYVNNVPHLGNIVGSVLSADVYARFCRAQGDETLFVCGTDGYGTATEARARQEGKTPADVCEHYHALHEAVYRHFQIQFDVFGKTFVPGHTALVQELFGELYAAGVFDDVITRGCYCARCETFLADRFVSGTCPECASTDARGDQCERCGKLLDPSDLRDAACVHCGEAPEWRESRHLFLALGRMEPRLRQWLEGALKGGGWSANAVTTTAGWLERGLQSRAMTRDLRWGVPVPLDGFRDKVFYVWFDAPLGYISMTRERDDWQRWWLDPTGTELHQFLGKDNIPFHSVLFPSVLLHSDRRWTMPFRLNVTEYLNYEGRKFSKSRGVGVFGTDVIELGLPVDYFRFYLMAVRPEKQDAQFSWEDFFDKVNHELVDNIGNLIQRVVVFQHKFLGPTLPAVCEVPSECEVFRRQWLVQLGVIRKAYEAGSLRSAVRAVLDLGHLGNKFFHDIAPWQRVGQDTAEVQRVIALMLALVRDLALVLEPVTPLSCGRLLADLLPADASSSLRWALLGQLEGLERGKLPPATALFPRLDPALLPELRERFAGQESGFSRMEIRFGRITQLRPHPAAAHLVVLQVDLGPVRGCRQVCAALARADVELTGRGVVVLCNVPQVDLGGVRSEAMVLIAEKRKKVDVLGPPQDEPVRPGARVSLSVRGGGETVVLPDVSVADFHALGLEVLGHQVTYRGMPLYLGGSTLRSELGRAKVK